MNIEQGSQDFQVEKVKVAGNQGPCIGIHRSIVGGLLYMDIIDGYQTPYFSHPLAHSDYYTKLFAEKGALYVDELPNRWDDVPDGAAVGLSPHGSPKEVYDIAKQKDLLIVDLTCQLVTRVISAGKRAETKGAHNIYIGKAGHPERIAVTGHLNPETTYPIGSVEEVDELEIPEGVEISVINQTTWSRRDTSTIIKRVREKFGERVLSKGDTLCTATNDRQEALERLLDTGVDFLIVQGSQRSHNSGQLSEIGREQNKPVAQINYREDINDEWFNPEIKIVGFTAGASAHAPETRRILGYFEERGVSIETLPPVRDETYLPLPYEDLQNLLNRWPTKKNGSTVVIPGLKEATIDIFFANT